MMGLESACRVEMEEKVATLGIDEESRVALSEDHTRALIPATIKARTIDTTTTQTVIWTNFWFFMLYFCSRVVHAT
jgi:hypothetical protein